MAINFAPQMAFFALYSIKKAHISFFLIYFLENQLKNYSAQLFSWIQCKKCHFTGYFVHAIAHHRPKAKTQIWPLGMGVGPDSGTLN